VPRGSSTCAQTRVQGDRRSGTTRRRATYKTFCESAALRRAQKPPHIKAPGKPRPNFTCYRHFTRACQCTTFAILRSPHRGVFHSAQGGELDKWNSYNRHVTMY